MQKITPFLSFGTQAEEAAKFYVSIFPNSRIVSVSRYGDAGAAAAGVPKGTVMVVAFQLAGQDFLALNGGPEATFSPAISLLVNCETQDEVDELWEKLTEGGQEVQCGWLTDRYGVSWQITPTVLMKMIQDKDAARADRVMRAMLPMKKLDIKTLQQAYEQQASA